MKNWNEKIAIFATKWCGTMFMFWLFFVFSLAPLIPLLAPARDSIFYISSGCLQLVFLPLILCGTNILGRDAETRSKQDHDTILEEFAQLKEMHEELREIVNTIRAQHEEI